MKFVLMLCLGLVNGFNLNPLKFSVNSDFGNVRIIQSYDKKQNNSIIFIPANINTNMPSEIYNNFLHNLAEKDSKIYIPDNDYNKIVSLSNNILKNDKNLIVVAHSNGAKNAINLCKDNNNIRQLVLIDPLDIGTQEKNSILDNMNFDILEKFKSNNEIDDIKTILNDIKKLVSESNDNDIQINVSNLNEVKKCLILKTQKSNNWKLFPTVPPINKLEMDVTSLDIDNNEIVNIESYGHFDIMDSVWADTFHKFVSEGSKDRSPYNIDKYHKYLSDKIIDYNDDEDF